MTAVERANLFYWRLNGAKTEAELKESLGIIKLSLGFWKADNFNIYTDFNIRCTLANSLSCAGEFLELSEHDLAQLDEAGYRNYVLAYAINLEDMRWFMLASEAAWDQAEKDGYLDIDKQLGRVSTADAKEHIHKIAAETSKFLKTYAQEEKSNNDWTAPEYAECKALALENAFKFRRKEPEEVKTYDDAEYVQYLTAYTKYLLGYKILTLVAKSTWRNAEKSKLFSNFRGSAEQK